MLIAVAADKGAPGVTTTAVALAAVWPRPVLLAECDPAGGDLVYVMSAVAQEQIDYMKKAGMPLSTHHTLTFTEVIPPRRLAYRNMVDFVPGVEPYQIETLLELQEIDGGGTRLVLTFDAMHDDHWTKMATMGWENELGRLARALEKRM